MGQAPFSLSIAKAVGGCSSTSFEYSFRPCRGKLCVTGVSFVPGTPKPGTYGHHSVGRQERRVELSSAVGRHAGGPICLGWHRGLAEFVHSVTIEGTGVWNDRDGIELASGAGS